MKLKVNLNEAQKADVESVSASKKKNPRAAFLSAFMKELGGEHGQGAISAFDAGDQEKFKSCMIKLMHNMSTSLGK